MLGCAPSSACRLQQSAVLVLGQQNIGALVDVIGILQVIFGGLRRKAEDGTSGRRLRTGRPPGSSPCRCVIAARRSIRPSDRTDLITQDGSGTARSGYRPVVWRHFVAAGALPGPATSSVGRTMASLRHPLRASVHRRQGIHREPAQVHDSVVTLYPNLLPRRTSRPSAGAPRRTDRTNVPRRRLYRRS